MIDTFLNFYTKYPWVAIIIVMQWIATAFVVISRSDADVTNILGVTFFATVVFAFLGFKIPKA